jgi:CO/xanthine dehydrogenase FAD-binding subunit
MDFVRVSSVEAALEWIGKGATPLAGGTIIVPEMTLRANAPDVLVDISNIDDLHAFHCAPAFTEIGAMVPVDLIAQASETETYLTALNAAANSLGTPQVRRAATLGGSLSAGLAQAGAKGELASAYDLAMTLLALGAEVVVDSATGSARLNMDQLFETGLPAGSLITKAEVHTPKGFRSAYRKFAWRKSAGKTIVNIALSLIHEHGTATKVRIAVGGNTFAIRRLSGVEALLEDKALSDALIDEAAKAASEEVGGAAQASISSYKQSLIRAGLSQILLEVSAA